jgi:hypothetical protein
MESLSSGLRSCTQSASARRSQFAIYAIVNENRLCPMVLRADSDNLTAKASRQSGRAKWMSMMKSEEEIKVAGLLLEFSKLEKRGREKFLENLNRYIFVSPTNRRKLRLVWETAAREATVRKCDRA